MVKVSELLSKQLICLDTATIEGTICNITFDSRLSLGKCLELFCEDENMPEKKYVQLKNITSLNQDAAVVKNCDNIIYEWQADKDTFNPINCLCYNSEGVSLGIVRDIILEGNRVEKIVLSSREFSPKDLLSYSDNLLIFNDTGKPIKINRVKPKIPKPVNTGEVTLHTDTQNSTKIVTATATNFSSFSSIQNTLPPENIDANNIATLSEPAHCATIPAFIAPESTKVLRSPLNTPINESSYSFLLNKIVRASISDNHGNVVIPENTCVTIDTIKTARANGKLVQLALRAY